MILGAARTVFSGQGIDDTSMRKIAGLAGVSPAVLYRHFADKDALLFALADAFFETLISRITQAQAGVTDPVKRLEAGMRAYLQCGLDHPHEYRLTFMTALPRLRRGQEMSEYRSRLRAGTLAPDAMPSGDVPLGMACLGMLERSVAAVIDAGLSREKNPAVLTEAIWASGHGLVSLIITHDDFEWSDRTALLESSIALMLHGLLTR